MGTRPSLLILVEGRTNSLSRDGACPVSPAMCNAGCHRRRGKPRLYSNYFLGLKSSDAEFMQ